MAVFLRSLVKVFVVLRRVRNSLTIIIIIIIIILDLLGGCNSLRCVVQTCGQDVNAVRPAGPLWCESTCKLAGDVC